MKKYFPIRRSFRLPFVAHESGTQESRNETQATCNDEGIYTRSLNVSRRVRLRGWCRFVVIGSKVLRRVCWMFAAASSLTLLLAHFWISFCLPASMSLGVM